MGIQKMYDSLHESSPFIQRGKLYKLKDFFRCNDGIEDIRMQFVLSFYDIKTNHTKEIDSIYEPPKYNSAHIVLKSSRYKYIRILAIGSEKKNDTFLALDDKPIGYSFLDDDRGAKFYNRFVENVETYRFLIDGKIYHITESTAESYFKRCEPNE